MSHIHMDSTRTTAFWTAVCFWMLILKTGALSGCVKNADCTANQYCRYYDHSPDMPQVWPPCPHFGLCVCVENTVMFPNGSCIPIATLHLGDECSNALNEQVANPKVMRCNDLGLVVCNWPYSPDLAGVTCTVTTTTSTTTVATTTTTITTTTSNSQTTSENETEEDTNVTIVTPEPVLNDSPSDVDYADYLGTCDPYKKLACDQPHQGLCCLLRGPSASYQQCQCCDPHHTYDPTLSKCRPRVYGDSCVRDEDCNSGLIASSGFECRAGACRCLANFEPVDNLYWNETGKSTYMRRICVIRGSAMAVPTGQRCTMNPHIYSHYNTTRICHRRAFCHQCFRERISYTDTRSQASGVCREFVCANTSQCQLPMRCNKFESMLDPPCEKGICDCSSKSHFYMDRFSRCSRYRLLDPGDRCLLGHPHGLYLWYQTNEDWYQSEECSAVQGLSQPHIGLVQCKLPNFEEVDGKCVPNNETEESLVTRRNFGEPCNDADLRLPRVVCDPEKRLFCHQRKCVCTENADSRPSYIFWDGTTCRSKKLGDPCQQDSECLTGSYYPPTVVGARCHNNVCDCAENFTALVVNSLQFDNGANTHTTHSAKYCFPPDIQIIGKGGDCHLDCIGYAEDCLHLPSWPGPTLICNASQGLYCLRCPSDFNPDDETMGICRSYKKLPFMPPPGYAKQRSGGTIEEVATPESPESIVNPVVQMGTCAASSLTKFAIATRNNMFVVFVLVTMLLQ